MQKISPAPYIPTPRAMMLFLFTVALLLCSSSAQAARFRIGIFVLQETPQYEEALQGFMEGLAVSGIPHETIVKRAYEDEGKGREVLMNFQEAKPDLLFTVGTRGTILATRITSKIPILFTAVTNPVASGIAQSWDKPGHGATGTSSWQDAAEVLRIFRETLPDMKSLGILYNPDNPVPVAEVGEVREACERQGLVLREEYIRSPEDIAAAAMRLVSLKIDALWIPRNDLGAADIGRVVDVTVPRRLPIVATTLEAIAREEGDAIVAVSPNYSKLGRNCVPLAARILLTGKSPSSIPIEKADTMLVTVSAKNAAILDYRLPLATIARADTILSGFAGQTLVVGGTGDSQDLLVDIAAPLAAKTKATIQIPESIGSSGGIKALLAGRIHLARVARSLTENETGQGLTYHLFARTPIVFVTHPDLSGVESISFEQIKGIYSGAITDWSQVGGPAGKIYPVGREPGDSCRTVIEQTIPGFAIPKEGDVKIIYSTPKMATIIERHRRTFGFLPLSAMWNRNLQMLKVNGVAPTAENIRSGHYPLAVPLALVSRGEPRGLGHELVKFLQSEEGQEIIRSNGSVPAP